MLALVACRGKQQDLAAYERIAALARQLARQVEHPRQRRRGVQIALLPLDAGHMLKRLAEIGPELAGIGSRAPQ